MAALAQKCVPVASSWVHQFIWMCDDRLAVQFHNGFCAYYPSTSKKYFEWALTDPSPGHFVQEHLYKLAYKPIKPPCPAQPCGGGGVQTGCCPNTVPATLYATISGGGTANGSHAMTYDATQSPAGWYGAAVGTCGLSFVCSGTSWVLNLGGGHFATSAVCNAFQVTFTGVDLRTCTGDLTAGNATVTVTP